MVGVVHCHRNTLKLGSSKRMEECNLSLAVDCTLSLGSTTLRTDAPARPLRVGSPDSGLALSLSVRSVQGIEPSRRTSGQQEEDMSWGGSCSRSDPDVSPEYYPKVSESEPRASDDGRRAFKAWPHEVKSSKALFGMIEDQTSRNRSRQPWLPNLSAANKVEQCMEDNDSCARVCAHCGTTKTPLWRNGPGGPKSLCNACGIRFKKAGRRSAANGTVESEVSPLPVATKTVKRKLESGEPQFWVVPADAKPRKRSRGSPPHRTSESFMSGSCMAWQSWSPPKSALQRDMRASPLSHSDDGKVPVMESGSFSSDEEEGAVLLMELLHGLVRA